MRFYIKNLQHHAHITHEYMEVSVLFDTSLALVGSPGIEFLHSVLRSTLYSCPKQLLWEMVSCLRKVHHESVRVWRWVCHSYQALQSDGIELPSFHTIFNGY